MLKNFANFILSGKLPAFTVVFGFLIFSLIFPLSAIVSGAAIVLLTLHANPRNSLVILIACILGFSICGQIFLGNVAVGALTATAQLVPSFMLALVLHSTRSLSLSMQISALLGSLAFVLINSLFPDAPQFWQSTLSPILAPMFEARGYSAENALELVSQTAKYTTGILIALVIFLHNINLLFGYKLYSIANNNSQFDLDFKNLRLSKVLAILALIVGIWAFLSKSAFAFQLSIILIIMFFFQGLAGLHTKFGTMTNAKLWLIITYVILVLLFPQSILILALLGLFETFFKSRARVK